MTTATKMTSMFSFHALGLYSFTDFLQSSVSSSAIAVLSALRRSKSSAARADIAIGTSEIDSLRRLAVTMIVAALVALSFSSWTAELSVPCANAGDIAAVLDKSMTANEKTRRNELVLVMSNPPLLSDTTSAECSRGFEQVQLARSIRYTPVS